MNEVVNELPDGFSITQTFRDKRRSSTAHGTFSIGSTLRGEVPLRCMISHRGHTTENCYSLNPSKRPDLWKMTLQGAKHTLKALTDLKKLDSFKDVVRECNDLIKGSITSEEPPTSTTPPRVVGHVGSMVCRTLTQTALTTTTPAPTTQRERVLATVAVFSAD